jgi:hypothetical protein
MINPDLMPGKPVQTRSGLEAVIYAVHEGQEWCIHGAYKIASGEWVEKLGPDATLSSAHQGELNGLRQALGEVK